MVILDCKGSIRGALSSSLSPTISGNNDNSRILSSEDRLVSSSFSHTRNAAKRGAGLSAGEGVYRVLPYRVLLPFENPI